jgi:hypothetical protein
MMPPMNTGALNGNSEEQKLRKLYRSLSEDDRKSLMDYAEFLLQRSSPEAEGELPEPAIIPRPESESVVKAVKRLSETYFMLDKDHMLQETSSLMAQHIMQGREAADVIDELEEVFARHYKTRQEQQS